VASDILYRTLAGDQDATLETNGPCPTGEDAGTLTPGLPVSTVQSAWERPWGSGDHES
jgi:hypothetical protein